MLSKKNQEVKDACWKINYLMKNGKLSLYEKFDNLINIVNNVPENNPKLAKIFKEINHIINNNNFVISVKLNKIYDITKQYT